MGPRKLILVDDESYVTAVIGSKLRKLGDEVVIASDGREALEMLRTFSPDLVVTDYQMPVMCGFELACALRDDPSHAKTPVIMLTARGHALSADELARTGIKSLLPKPFSARVLIAKIEELIGPPRTQDAPGPLVVKGES